MELIKSCEEMCHELRARLVCKGLRLLIELAEALVHGDLLCENRPSAIRRQLKDIRPAIGIMWWCVCQVATVWENFTMATSTDHLSWYDSMMAA